MIGGGHRALTLTRTLEVKKGRSSPIAEAWMRRSSRYRWRPAAIEMGQRGCHICVIHARESPPREARGMDGCDFRLA
jgi:hypothetical protein